MSTETRMAIEHSIPTPQRSESGVSVRYETKVFSLWDRKASAEVAHACMFNCHSGFCTHTRSPVIHLRMYAGQFLSWRLSASQRLRKLTAS
jgi:hypothetical protein